MWGRRQWCTENWLISFVALLLNVVLLAAGPHAFADCEPPVTLEGTVSIECCIPPDECISAGRAIYDYSMSAKVDPDVLSISTQASPWHLYDGDMRIIPVEELAEGAKAKLRDGVKRIVLVASWTGVAPDRSGKSLAQKLSDALGGFPVSGMDGFVWIAKDGSIRTTRQAYTIKQKCPYAIHPGDEVMVSLVPGWLIAFEEDYIKKRDSEGIMRAGAGWDIFMLCPERALQSFEAAAALSNPIAAYNAALIRLERGKDGDLEAAAKLLTQAAKLGDKKAKARLQEMNRQGR